MNERDTICAVATGRGEAAIGVIRLSGPAALAIVRTLCGLVELRPRRMHATVLRHGGAVVDQAMVCHMPAPRSYTGEEVVEIHGHGGRANLERMLSVLVELGARMATPGEFTRRAFENGRIDLLQAEAVAEVIGASDERALKNAQAILAGELGRKVHRLRDDLVAAAADLEACIDFGEETAAELDIGEERRQLARLAQGLGELADTYHEGRRLEGATVAFVGAVNAGKSSLFNRLLGTTRALVHEEPGTTRDLLEARLSCDGYTVTLLDTAGKRDGSTGVEAAGQRLGQEAAQRCDLVVEVVDLAADQADGATVERADLVVANKMDLVSAKQVAEAVDYWRAKTPGAVVLATSALQGEGIPQLRRAILDKLFPSGGGAGETVMVTRRRQWEMLLRARDAVAEGREALDGGRGPELVVEHVREALRALQELTGERFTEEVLDRLFASFCLGK